jgi:hypothetical protein
MAFADTIRTARPTRENIATLIEQAGLSYPAYCTSVSGTNTITAICSGLAAYTTGFKIIFKGANANTGAATINLNSLGAKSLKMPDGSALIGGEISTTSFTEAIYDGTNFILHSFKPVWTSFTPTYSTNAGSGIISDFTATYAKFKHYGDRLKIEVLCQGGSLSSTATYIIIQNSPKAAANLGSNQLLFAYTFLSGNADTALASVINNSNDIYIYKDTNLTSNAWPINTGGLLFMFAGEIHT